MATDDEYEEGTKKIFFFNFWRKNVWIFNIFFPENEIEEPEEVKQAWDELLLIQREQQRYSDIKYDLEQDLEFCKKKQTKLEDVSTGCSIWNLSKTHFGF